MQLTFKPVINRIGDDYFIVPKEADTDVHCVIKCNYETAQIICLMEENKNEEELIAAARELFPDEDPDEVADVCRIIRASLKHSLSSSTS